MFVSVWQQPWWVYSSGGFRFDLWWFTLRGGSGEIRLSGGEEPAFATALYVTAHANISFRSCSSSNKDNNNMQRIYILDVTWMLLTQTVAVLPSASYTLTQPAHRLWPASAHPNITGASTNRFCKQAKVMMCEFKSTSCALRVFCDFFF